MRFVDFFAGAGGLSHGIMASGHRLLSVVEKDEMSITTNNANHAKNSLTGPAKTLNVITDEAQIRRLLDQVKPDLVVGGPPCQGFSAAGRRQGDDPRNTLPLVYAELALAAKPKIIVMENVEGMTQSASRSDGKPLEVQVLDAYLQRLASEGYETSRRVLQADSFGVPQTRRRLFVVASRKDVDFDHFSLWTDVQRAGNSIRASLWGKKAPCVGPALEDLHGPERIPCPDAPRFETIPYGEAKSTYSRAMRGRLVGVPQSHRLANHGPVVRARFQRIMQEGAKGRVSRDVLRTMGKLSTNKQKIHWLDPDEPATTISSQPGDFLHPWEPRELTVREMARLQGFPDSFEFHGRYTINGPRRPYDTARCSQVGNAVPPQFAQAIGAAIAVQLPDSKTHEKKALELTA